MHTSAVEGATSHHDLDVAAASGRHGGRVCGRLGGGWKSGVERKEMAARAVVAAAVRRGVWKTSWAATGVVGGVSGGG
jgi:hypothetical protein